jgi:hypothetical protein
MRLARSSGPYDLEALPGNKKLLAGSPRQRDIRTGRCGYPPWRKWSARGRVVMRFTISRQTHSFRWVPHELVRKPRLADPGCST